MLGLWGRYSRLCERPLWHVLVHKRVLGVAEMDFLYHGYYTFRIYYISDILLAASTYGVFWGNTIRIWANSL